MLTLGYGGGSVLLRGVLPFAILVVWLLYITAHTDFGRERSVDAFLFPYLNAAIDSLTWPAFVFSSELLNNYTLSHWHFSLAPYYMTVVGISILSGSLLLIVMLFNNKKYETFRFSSTLVIGFVLSYLILSSTLALMSRGSVQEEDINAAMIFLSALICLLHFIRWQKDLYLAFWHKKSIKASLPLIAGFVREIPYLKELRVRDDCRLPALDKSELAARISASCRNLERTDPLILRNLVQFRGWSAVEAGLLHARRFPNPQYSRDSKLLVTQT